VNDSLTLDRLHVDVDQIARERTGQAAEPHHVEVLENLLDAHTEIGGDVLDPGTVAVAQVWHQGEQALDLFLRAAAHPSPPPVICHRPPADRGCG
jgi:hypothetical protein